MLLFDPNKPFYKGNLHTHTTVSDGGLPPEAVMSLYESKGYDFLALTDHWKIASGERMYRSMLVLPGFETDFNLPDQVVHLVSIGCGEDTLQGMSRGMSPVVVAQKTQAAGGAVILAHPAWSLNTTETICALSFCDAAEIYNTLSGTPWNGDRADSLSILDIAASHGAILPTTASDDAHFYTGEAGRAFILGQTDELSVKGIVAMLRSGKWYSSTGAKITNVNVEKDVVSVTLPEEADVLFMTDCVFADNRCQQHVKEAIYPIEPRRRETFLRIVVIAKDGSRAWVNPIKL